MNRVYMLRSKKSKLDPSFYFDPEKNASDRATQLVALSQHRLSSSTEERLQGRISQLDITRLSPGEGPLPITGMTIVRMSEEQAIELGDEFPDVAITPDFVMNVVTPPPAEEIIKQNVTDKDLWHLSDAGLNLFQARKDGLVGQGDGVTVAVLDVGIHKHPAFNGGKIAGAVTLNSGKFQELEPISPEASGGHGTLVAGLVCGERIGVAPGSNVFNVKIDVPQIMSEDNIQIFASDVMTALDWIGSNLDEARIVNLSLGVPGFRPELQPAIADVIKRGILPVAAIGGTPGAGNSESPGNYKEVLSVGASTQDGKVAILSSSDTITIGGTIHNVPKMVAPGENIWTSFRDKGFVARSGTSFAAPIVSGLAALILERNPKLTANQLMGRVLSLCQPLTNEDRVRQGQGLPRITAPL